MSDDYRTNKKIVVLSPKPLHPYTPKPLHPSGVET